MKQPVKIDVVTRRKGLFGLREVIRKRTITIPAKECCRTQRRQWNQTANSEEERLAALYRMWEEELAETGRGSTGE